MKTFNLIKIFVSLAIFMSFMLFLGNEAHAAKAIDCKTPYGEKTFVIGDHSLAMKKENAVGRSISSVLSARTKVTHKGFVKTMYVGLNKYKINISNKNQFSGLNDYLVITSPKGHKVTYPLYCN